MRGELPKEEFDERRNRARKYMRKQGMDALLITDKWDYWYFTGHRSRQFNHQARPMPALLPMDRDPVFVLPPRVQHDALTVGPKRGSVYPQDDFVRDRAR